MTNITISDGTTTVTLKATKIERNPNVRLVSNDVGTVNPVTQFFERNSMEIDISGEAGNEFDGLKSLWILQRWMSDGKGIVTGTLTYTDEDDPSGISVIIPPGGVSWTEYEGQTDTGFVSYNVKLIEV